MTKRFKHSSHCCVPRCLNHEGEGLSFHGFPSDENLKAKWEKILKMEKPASRFMRVCSEHFASKDFFPGSNRLRRRLKKSAIPRLKLPNTDKKSKKSSSPKKMLKDEANNDIKDNNENVECRACLQICPEGERYELFKCWEPPWSGMEDTVAEDFAKLTNVQVFETDRHSKVLCHYCYKMVQEANNFIRIVRNSDELLRKRYPEETNGEEKCWPKPIQIDKNIENLYDNVKIKEEVESDEESYAHLNGTDQMQDFSKVDIKIEAGEWDESEPVKINGTISLSELNAEMAQLNESPVIEQPQVACDINDSQENMNGIIMNGKDADEHNQIDMEIKEEPPSEDEVDENIAPDLPLDCILCMKTFLSISGLKAHVIAQHSYKTVKRKHSDCSSPDKRQFNYVCNICQRRFETSTDLMVHETCHNKSVCYGCNASFDTFDLLTEHRRTCKAIAKSAKVAKLVTLDDVKRPSTKAQIELNCPQCPETFTDAYYMDLHLEIHHPSSDPGCSVNSEEENMEVEALESLLEEDS